MEAVNDQVTEGYELIEYNIATQVQTKLGNPIQNTFDDIEQLDDSVYEDASSARPYYRSPNQVTNNYYSIENMTRPQIKLVNPIPKIDSTENNLDEAKQHTNKVCNNSKTEKARKNDDRNHQKTNFQESLANLTPLIDKASEKGDDVYDAEEKTFSEANKYKKPEENPRENDYGERKVD